MNRTCHRSPAVRNEKLCRPLGGLFIFSITSCEKCSEVTPQLPADFTGIEHRCSVLVPEGHVPILYRSIKHLLHRAYVYTIQVHGPVVCSGPRIKGCPCCYCFLRAVLGRRPRRRVAERRACEHSHSNPRCLKGCAKMESLS